MPGIFCMMTQIPSAQETRDLLLLFFFLNFQEAESALHGLNGKLALSKHLTVNWARFKGTTYVVSVYIITRICEHFCIPVDIF